MNVSAPALAIASFPFLFKIKLVGLSLRESVYWGHAQQQQVFLFYFFSLAIPLRSRLMCGQLKWSYDRKGSNFFGEEADTLTPPRTRMQSVSDACAVERRDRFQVRGEDAVASGLRRLGQVGAHAGLVHGVQHVLAVHGQVVGRRQHLLAALVPQRRDGVLLRQTHLADQLRHVVVQQLLGALDLRARVEGRG